MRGTSVIGLNKIEKAIIVLAPMVLGGILDSYTGSAVIGNGDNLIKLSTK